jgi:Mce-associated membrane protein
MAADAGTPDGELRQTTVTEAPPASVDSTKLTSADEPDASDVPDDKTLDYDDAVDDETEHDTDDAVDNQTEHETDDAVDDETELEIDNDAAPAKHPTSHARLATVFGLVTVVALAAVVGWLGFQAYQSRQAQEQRQLFVQVGRQGALNLTTIDWQHADTDVQRILDSATGAFYDDFSKRQQPFIEVVKKAQAKSVGTINEAGLESMSGNEAQVLVAVSVNTTNLGAAQQEPRAWRMRISVQKVGGDAKISNVAFVP